MTSRPADGRPRVFTIPLHRSFADALATGVIARFGSRPEALAAGRILLPNNRAVRTVTDAFVRASGESGLLLPRLVPIGDPELDERIGTGLEAPADERDIPPAIDPLERLFALAAIVRPDVGTASEALRLARDLAATLDVLLVEKVDPARLRDCAGEDADLALHWSRALDRLQAIIQAWPERLAMLGRIDLADRRNRLLEAVARRWRDDPPDGFTIAAGISTAAPAIAALLSRIARMPDGMVVLPGLALEGTMDAREWDALGPGEDGEGGGSPTHPQYHLKRLLDRMGVARGEVAVWRSRGRSASPPARTRAVANAMAAPEFSAKWTHLRAVDRRLSGVRTMEADTPASEALGIALAIRQALEQPGRTVALATPDRTLARRVSEMLRRWRIEADDSAGTPLSRTPAGTLLLGLAGLIADDFAPVALLALAKHPLVGGEDEARRAWLDKVRLVDLALRGPRPGAGLAGLDAHFAEYKERPQTRGCRDAWRQVRARVAGLAAAAERIATLPQLASALADAARGLAGERAWGGADGRAAAKLIEELAQAPLDPLALERADYVPALDQLLSGTIVRPPYGGHPRVQILGLLEARLHHADLMILGGLNEGAWPPVPRPDPWLAPRIRALLGLPGLDERIGLTAHDFAGALGAPSVLITRSRRDSRAPTVASRFWLRLQAMTGGLPRDLVLERLTAVLDEPDAVLPADKPRVAPPVADRPRKIAVTDVDRLKADPFAFYARSILRLRPVDPVEADHHARWKGSAVHTVLEQWLKEDDCDPGRLHARAEAMLAEDSLHPMLRALWRPRLMEAMDFIAAEERKNRAAGRRPLIAEARGETVLAGIELFGAVDRIDRLPGGGLAIIDYKTGKPPGPKQVEAGFALQLGLLGLIAMAGGFPECEGEVEAHEYWSLAKAANGSYGRVSRPDDKSSAAVFRDRARSDFIQAAERWLTGSDAFVPKLQPAYARDDYDQLMRLEEWYGRS